MSVGVSAVNGASAAVISTPYVVRKNIDSTGAITLRSPSHTATSARPRVSQVPLRGASSSPLPVPSQSSHDGRMPSRAMACNTRGAPRIEPTALDNVAPQMPSKMASPQKAILRITIGSSINVSDDTRSASRMGSAM